jgi:uncharacterized protein (DUF924 family)
VAAVQYTVTHKQYSSSTVHSYTQTVQQQYSTQLHTNSAAAVQYTVTHKQYSSSTVHSYTQTVQQQYSTHLHTQTVNRTTQNKQYAEQHKNKLEQYGLFPVLASYTLAFALQVRKKHGKTSVRVAEQ